MFTENGNTKREIEFMTYTLTKKMLEHPRIGLFVFPPINGPQAYNYVRLWDMENNPEKVLWVNMQHNLIPC